NLARNRLTFLPPFLAHLSKLERLTLSGNPITEIQTDFSQLAALSVLEFDDQKLRDHSFLAQTLQLNSLSLRKSRHLHLPDGDWMNRLRYLDLRASALTNFPTKLARVTDLEHLHVDDARFLGYIPGQDVAQRLQQFFRDTAGGKLPSALRQFYLQVLLLDTAAVKACPAEARWSALDATQSFIRQNALTLLHDILPNPLNRPDLQRVVLLGHFNELNRSQARRVLKEKGIKLGGLASGPGTVVIVGERPGKNLGRALDREMPVGVEGHLVEFLQANSEAYLTAAHDPNDPMLANLLSLLNAAEGESVMMALSFMEGGGIPEKALSRVVVLRFFHKAEAVRKQAAALLQKHQGRSFSWFLDRCFQQARREFAIDGVALLRLLCAHAELDPEILVGVLTELKLYGSAKGEALKLILEMPKPTQEKLLPQVLGPQVQMDRIELEALPEALFDLTEVMHLVARYNALTDLSPKIAQLTKLEALDLSFNQLRALPEALWEVEGLHDLNVSNNLLHHVPMPDKVHGLKALMLDRNPLEGLPDGLERLKWLELLSLYGCELGRIPDFVWEMRTLRDLELGDNGLKNLPEKVGDLRWLRTLNLKNNPIDHFPEWIGELPALKYLDLSYSRATHLPESLRQSTSLERIYLTRDESMNWEQVVDVLKDIPSLRNLYLKRGKIVREVEKMIGDRLPDGVRITLTER
ncbi:MAG: hypothetical protein AAF570_11050, partial [Bacteroidota bacterium]